MVRKPRGWVRHVRTIVSLPEDLVEKLDALGDEMEIPRTAIIEDLLAYCLEHEDVIDEVFPEEEEAAAEA